MSDATPSAPKSSNPGTGRLVLTLPLRSPPLSANDQRRAHWTQVAKAKREMELIVTSAINQAKAKPIDGPVTVQLVWYAPTAHARDTDGLAPMMKACLDALVKKKVLVDDNNRVVHQTILGPIVVSRDRPRFELIIKRLEG